MLTTRLRGIETLEQKQMLTTGLDAGLDVPPAVAGDVNGDNAFDQRDIMQMLRADKYNTDQSASILDGDFNGDGRFNQLDLVAIQIQGKYHQPTYRPGDANRDGRFNQLDVVLLLQQDKYMKDQPADWGSGDFNGDGRFDQYDLVMALQEGDYDTGS